MVKELIARVFGQKAITNSAELQRELQSAGAKAGVTVNWKTALEAVVSYACARVIAEGIAQVPFKLYRRQDDRRNPATDHPLYELLYRSPNEYQTSFEYRETMAMHLVFAGGGYSFINRDRGGAVSEILQYQPGEMTVKRDGWLVRYYVTLPSGQEKEIPAANMWHVKGPSWNGWMGLDGVKLAREAIGLSLAAEEYGARYFSNGAQPGGLLSTDQPLDKEKAKQLREAWEEIHAGGDNKFKTGVVWGGLKWTSLAFDNEKSQFLETRKFQIEEVCRAFRVNPIMVGYTDKATTYASAEQMFLAHVVHTLAPWYTRIEMSADKHLLTEKEIKAGYYFKFNANGLMRGSMKDRMEYYKGMAGIGAMNPNEIRELEEQNPYEGGDKYLVPLNMTDASKAGEEGNQDEQV